MYRIPRATYRLQFNPAFTFAHARAIAGYLAELGISDLYASPILKSRKGSAHGYDVVDSSSLNPDLGSDDDFSTLHAELQRLELGLLLDVVPNHMAASPENAWWMSVLENGPNSRYLHYFDIDWSPVTTRGETVNKVVLPILGKPYGEALESQEIQLRFDAEGLFFTYYDKRLPLNVRSYRTVLRECLDALPSEGVGIELRELVEGDSTITNTKFLKETLWRIYEQDERFRDALNHVIQRLNGEPGNTESFNRLDELLDRQWYRLAYWRIASEKINYRRFFDVTDLVGVRVENPEVFEARNRRTLELIAEGKLTGLRIDHIDGLYDPIGYMQKLQRRLQTADEGGPCFYVVLEKILAHGEQLPGEFPVAGTTGYDFLNALNTVFVNPDGLEQLDAFYRNFSGVTEPFAEIAYEKKKQIIHELFSGEMRALGKQLSALAMSDRNARDFAPVELTSALTEVTASMSVYRTYIRDTAAIADSERQCIREAVGRARDRAGTTIDQRLLTFLESVLLVDPPSYLAGEREHWLAFVMRWQQFTGRVMAKGVEDTSFYTYNRLISMNEVGGEPGRSGFDGLAEFHRHNERRQRDWPHTLNATSTHDTKRSEDVRARINVISELPDAWARQVRKWSKMNGHLRRDGIPHPNEELLLYQTLIGMWPLDEDDMSAVPERLRQYLEKAAREAKTHTSWIAPNPRYEEALLAFGAAILENREFCEDFARVQRRFAFHGFLNGLAQVVLKATSPGAPDFYQGSELWDLSLVDPDNRRPVDYERRSSMLRKMKKTPPNLDTMLRRWADGRVKMYVTWKLLELRARRTLDGYEPVDGGRNVCAFRRGDVLVAVPRLTTELGNALPLGEKWHDRALPVRGAWTNLFTGESVEGDPLRLSNVFAKFPVAVLEAAPHPPAARGEG